MRFKRRDENKPRTINKYFPATPVEVLSLQNFFEKMSEKGYMLTGIRGVFYEFKECEPKKRRFQVDYFKNASIFDSKPEYKTLEYLSYCKSAGWNHILSSGKMQCFYTEDMESPEIETDDGFRFQSIIKAEFMTHVVQWILALLYTLLGIDQLKFMLTNYYSWIDFLTSPVALAFSLFLSAFVLFSIFDFLDFLRIYLNNKTRLKNGQSLKLYSLKQGASRIRHRMLGMGTLLFLLVIGSIQSTTQFLIMVIFIGLMICILFIVTRFLKSEKSNRKRNVMMTIGISLLAIPISNLIVLGGFNGFNSGENEVLAKDGSIITYTSDPIPVNLNDLGYGVEENSFLVEDSMASTHTTFIGKKTFFTNGFINEEGYRENLETNLPYPFFDVTIFESKLDWPINRYVELYVDREEEKSISKTQYAELIKQGYQGYLVNKYETHFLMLVKDKKTICIASHEQLSEENILRLLAAI